MRRDPIFFENSEDDNHCLQAAVMMVLNSLGHSVRWGDVEAATEYEENLYSWTVQGAAAISKYITGVQLISSLNYGQFAQEGVPYLRRFWRPCWFALQERKASKDFEKERKAAKDFIRTGTAVEKKITFDEMFPLVDDHLCITVVEVDKLYPKRNLGSHFVVLYANDGDCVWLHDPGRPPLRSQKLPKARVYAAATGPELIAVPLGSNRFGPAA